MVETRTNTPLWRWQPPPDHSCCAAALSPDGRYLIAGMNSGTVYIFRLPPAAEAR